MRDICPVTPAWRACRHWSPLPLGRGRAVPASTWPGPVYLKSAPPQEGGDQSPAAGLSHEDPTRRERRGVRGPHCSLCPQVQRFCATDLRLVSKLPVSASESPRCQPSWNSTTTSSAGRGGGGGRFPRCWAGCFPAGHRTPTDARFSHACEEPAARQKASEFEEQRATSPQLSHSI